MVYDCKWGVIPKTTLTIAPHTGRVSTASVLQAKTKRRPSKWVRPPSKRGKVERIMDWKNFF